MRSIEPLADSGQILYDSPDPQSVYPGSPGIWRTSSGQIVVTYDIRGGGAQDLPGVKYEPRPGQAVFGNVLTSDDGGETWIQRTQYPFLHARPFEAGDALYVLGHAGDLAIIRSDDGGDTWSTPSFLTNAEHWHQAPTNVWYANGCVYLVMEQRCHFRVNAWPVSELAPVLMRAPVNADLADPAAWTYASRLSFVGAVKDAEVDWLGVPFYPAHYPDVHGPEHPGRGFAPIGWLETNVVRIDDPNHYWHDPSGRTFHLFARAHTGRTNLACVAKVVQRDDGSMDTMLEAAPSGHTMLHMPFPGGQMKFHILFDDGTQLFWLVSTQATDSMTRFEKLPDTRYRMADNERRRLVLHFSKNCVDWCFAGLICQGDTDVESRHYASMAIDGDDMLILSRSGDERAKNPHDVNRITLHRVRAFRDLVY